MLEYNFLNSCLIILVKVKHFSSIDEGSSAPPEGDIAALAAKVQGSGISSNKKKYKKHQELTENASLLSDVRLPTFFFPPL